MIDSLRNIFLVLTPLGIIFFVFSFLSMTFAYNRTGDKKFNFFTYFPFELNQFKRYQKSSYIYEIAVIFSSLLLIFGLIFFSIYMVSQEKYIALIISIILFIAILSFNFLLFAKLSVYKLHLILAIIWFFSTLLSCCLELILFTNINTIGIINDFQKFSILIICSINILFMLVLLLNKSYKNWAKMVKVDAQTYNRPKRCYLAILEWGTLISLFIDFIPLIILLIK